MRSNNRVYIIAGVVIVAIAVVVIALASNSNFFGAAGDQSSQEDITTQVAGQMTVDAPTAEPPTAAPPTAEPPTAEPPTAEPPTDSPADAPTETTQNAQQATDVVLNDPSSCRGNGNFACTPVAVVIAATVDANSSLAATPTTGQSADAPTDVPTDAPNDVPTDVQAAVAAATEDPSANAASTQDAANVAAAPPTDTPTPTETVAPSYVPPTEFAPLPVAANGSIGVAISGYCSPYSDGIYQPTFMVYLTGPGQINNLDHTISSADSVYAQGASTIGRPLVYGDSVRLSGPPSPANQWILTILDDNGNRYTSSLMCGNQSTLDSWATQTAEAILQQPTQAVQTATAQAILLANQQMTQTKEAAEVQEFLLTVTALSASFTATPPSTETPVPTATTAPPTDTPAPTATNVPATDTPAPTATIVLPTDTTVPATSPSVPATPRITVSFQCTARDVYPMVRGLSSALGTVQIDYYDSANQRSTFRTAGNGSSSFPITWSGPGNYRVVVTAGGTVLADETAYCAGQNVPAVAVIPTVTTIPPTETPEPITATATTLAATATQGAEASTSQPTTVAATQVAQVATTQPTAASTTSQPTATAAAGATAAPTLAPEASGDQCTGVTNAPPEVVAALDELLAQLINPTPGHSELVPDAKGAPGAVIRIETPDWIYYEGTGVADVATGELIRCDQPYEIGSATKMMTALVLLQLQEEGLLNIDDPLSDYLPEFAAALPNGDQITLRMLANHTSGLFNYTDNAADGTPGLMEGGLADPALLSKGYTPEELVQYAIDHGTPNFEPGAEGQWSYSNTNYVLMGLIIEKLTGKSLADVFEERIFAPLGMDDTFLWNDVPEESFGLPQAYFSAPFDINTSAWNMSQGWAAGAVISTADDMAKFVRGLLNGELFANDDTLSIMQESVFANGILAQYGIGLMSQVDNTWGHNGQTLGFESVAMYNTTNDMSIIIWTNSAENLAVVGEFEVDKALQSAGITP